MDDQQLTGEAVFYLGLCELVEPRLAASSDYGRAVKALDACWRWIEQKNVPAKTLLDEFHDDDDFGVEASMGVEHDRVLWNVWACVAVAVVATTLAAYRSEGATFLPANIEGVDAQETRSQFADSFRVLIPLDSVLDRYRSTLDALSTQRITRSRARDLAFRALHSTGMPS